MMLDPAAFNFRHLGGFVAALHRGSITAAAQDVNLSQPTLTQAIAKLERMLTQPLLERTPSGVRATKAGELFGMRAQRALNHLAGACAGVRRTARLAPIPFPERTISMTQLNAFLAIEREGNSVAAARRLGKSQPSVHRASRELELVLGVPLLLHVARLLRPTVAGEYIVRGGRLALAELRAGIEDVQSLVTGGSGRVTVGTLALARSSLLPRTLARFGATEKAAEIVIQEGAYADLVTGLRTGEIDLFLGALRRPETITDLNQEALFDDHLFIVGRMGHPLTDGVLSVARLAEYPWVVGPPQAPMRSTWQDLFTGRKLPEQTIQCSSVLTTRGLLIRSDWLALLYPTQFELEEQAGVLCRLGHDVPGSRRSIGVTTRRDWRPTRVQERFVEALRETAASLGLAPAA